MAEIVDYSKPHVFIKMYADLCKCGKWKSDSIHVGGDKVMLGTVAPTAPPEYKPSTDDEIEDNDLVSEPEPVLFGG